ncbi:ADP-ribosyl cyclase/cyclic ADP-ribose hydrolase 1-like [Kryptolebias marmoratus]|uniref:ADP-ribosyl cyclase/cyclic ADP-ribose hydrolase n=1 Tax=Kryptolebias marmoratus TaxID=37003 RepID=A0A3Q3B4F7_KRYMA|nr:ADP-ribosyl cyclase/cyclic ADP-ribose hydrolase 1-like [Kryptolebias marmoratus]
MELKTILAVSGAVFIALIVIVVPPTVLLSPRTTQIRATFMKKCQNFSETKQRCEQVRQTFEEAYVGQAPCGFAESNYDQLFTENPLTHSCGKTMFWSGTKDLVHRFTQKRDHFITLEDTLLGHIMNRLTWCGRKGSKDTFTYLCEKCPVNTVSSFWMGASARFAAYACGSTTVMLNGQKNPPFNPNGFFGKVEVPELKYPEVKSLTVILVTKNNKVDCNQESLQILRKILDPNVAYDCKPVTEARIQQCIEDGITGSCWS